MKNTLKTLTTAFIALSLSACVSTDPVYKNYLDLTSKAEVITNENNNINETNALKYAFKFSLPKNEATALVDTLKEIDPKTNMLRNIGANTALISATGLNPTSSAGMGVGLGLSLLDKYLTSQPMFETYTSMSFTEEWLGEKNITEKRATELAVFKMTKLVNDTGKAFNYNVECLFNCNTRGATFLLKKNINTTSKYKYTPESIAITFLFDKLKAIKSNDLVLKVFDEKLKFKSDRWLVSIGNQVNNTGYDKTWFELDITDSIGVLENKNSILKLSNGRTITNTAIGRDMLRDISENMKRWVLKDESIAIFESQTYELAGTSKANMLKGIKTIN